MSLDDCALIRRNATSHRASSWDRRGGNLDFISDLAPGASAVLLAAAGPGKITHIWMTLSEFPRHDTVLRDLVIRMYWEDSTVPSVEVPMGDFFGVGHALPAEFYARRKFQLVSAPVTVGQNERAFNCYWPMPFHRSARVEIHNNGTRTLRILYFHIDYELGPQPENSGLFHANFRQEKDRRGQMPDDHYVNLTGEENYVLLETQGCGQYLGCFYYIDTTLGAWWGEGDDMIYIDGNPVPALYGTGTEDYFNNAWGFAEPFSFPYYGAPLLAKREDGGEYNTLYRFHIPDPVHFREDIKVTMECWWLATQTINIASVAFWYQENPIGTRTPLPAGPANHPHLHALPPEDRWKHGDGGPAPGQTRVGCYELEESLRAAGVRIRLVSTIGPHGLGIFGGGGAVIETGGNDLAIGVPVPADGRYRVEVKPVYALLEGAMSMWTDGGEKTEAHRQTFAREDEGPFILIGEAEAQRGSFNLNVSGNPVATIQAILLSRL